MSPDTGPISVEAPPATPPARWGLARRIAFRFAFCYVTLYLLPFPVNQLPEWVPGAGTLLGWYDTLLHEVVRWVGKHALHVPYEITVFTNGSGDTTYDYLLVLCFAALAVVATLLWTVLDRRGSTHGSLHEALRVYVRYALAAILLSYGFDKVFKLQFPAPSPGKLVQPFGESSPMGLLWTFMGHSTAYTIWSGALEVLGGTLLLFRRTTTLGALVTAAVMANIVMLNFSYDVPVKLYSTHLLVLASFLLIPDVRRLADVFLLQRATQPQSLTPPFPTGRLRYARLIAKSLFIGYTLFAIVTSCLEALKAYGDHAPRIAMFGVYEVEEVAIAGDATSAGSRGWKRVGVTNTGLRITLNDGSVRLFQSKDDPDKKTLSLSPWAEPAGKAVVLAYTQPDPWHATLEGELDGKAVRARLLKLDTSKYLLLTRGFHWIQEYPFNR